MLGGVRPAIRLLLASLVWLVACDDVPTRRTYGPADPGVEYPDRSACGTPTIPDGTSLRRRPYLQSVTANTATLAWTSRTSGTSIVRFREAGAATGTEVAATPEDFPTARTGDTEAYTMQVARLEGLTAETLYCYEVEENGVVLATGLSFESAWTRLTRPVRILAFGDSGTGSAEQLGLRDVMGGMHHDVFLHLGDMAYPTGRFVDFEANVFDVYADLMRAIPQFPAIGNHEYMTNAGQPYLDVYALFDVALRPADREKYYSFDYGDVHFVSLDSNPEMLGTLSDAAADDMVDWLRNDLAASTKTWKIAFFHHPAYSSGLHGSTPGVQQHIVPALEEGGVDLVLVGHDHHYERTIPIYQGDVAASTDTRAITYVLEGAGGAELRPCFGAWFTEDCDYTSPSFLSFVVDGCVGHGRAVAIDGLVIDEFDVNGCE